MTATTAIIHWPKAQCPPGSDCPENRHTIALESKEIDRASLEVNPKNEHDGYDIMKYMQIHQDESRCVDLKQ